MPRHPAKHRQVDIARAIKAVQQTGADMRVRLAPDGSIIIEKGPDISEDPPVEARPAYAF